MIKYSKKIDKEIFKEVNTMGDKLSPLFGFNFPKLKFDEFKSNKVDIFWCPGLKQRVEYVMKKIYGRDIPNFNVYMNTTPFSTWNLKDRWLSISIDRGYLDFENTVMHEANHFMYDYCFGTKKYEDTNIKESVVALNELFGYRGISWNKFKKSGEEILELYKTHSLKEIVNKLKKTKFFFSLQD